MSIFKRKPKKARAKTPEFAFCETVTAGPFTPNHIRRLDEHGLKLNGGATTQTLCQRSLYGGWDLTTEVSTESVQRLSTPRSGDGRVFACTKCAQAYLDAQ